MDILCLSTTNFAKIKCEKCCRCLFNSSSSVERELESSKFYIKYKNILKTPYKYKASFTLVIKTGDVVLSRFIANAFL